MNTVEFIDVLKEVVLEDSVKSVQTNLLKPPGTKPAEKLTVISEWYKSLTDKDKGMVIRIIRESAETTTFSFLCVLDGAKAIENANKGELKLYYQNGNDTVLLNDTNKVNLHELL